MDEAQRKLINKERCKAWRIANKKRVQEANRIYRENNKQKVKEDKKKWNEANIVRKSIHTKKWEAVNGVAKSANSAKRRAFLRGLEGRYSAKDIEDIFQLQRGMCAYCSIDIQEKYHIDHIVSLSRGGSNYRKNIQLLCAPCNLSKGNKDPIDFARQLGRLI